MPLKYFFNRESYHLTKSLLKEERFAIARLIIKKRLKINGLSKKHIKLTLLLRIRTFLQKVT